MNTLNRFGLPDEVFDEILDVLRKYPQIDRAVIFGSRAKGNHKRYSDIDIAVFSDIDSSFVNDISSDLDELDIIYYTDVIHYEKVSNHEIKAHIDRVGIEIFSRNSDGERLQCNGSEITRPF